MCNGWIGPRTPIIEASSGSTAVSEAYFARLLGLRFIAVMPRSTSGEKVAQIAFLWRRKPFRRQSRRNLRRERAARRELGGHYMDQFTFAERATDWRGNNNIAEAFSSRWRAKPIRSPPGSWSAPAPAARRRPSAAISAIAGWRPARRTSASSIPRTRFFAEYFVEAPIPRLKIKSASKIEGIGRPRVEPSFICGVIDRMIRVPDAASFASIRFSSSRLIGKKMRRLDGHQSLRKLSCSLTR